MTPTPKRTTYEFDQSALAGLFAGELKVDRDRVTVEFKSRRVGDERFGTAVDMVYAVEVHVSAPISGHKD